jgi:beta-galactosidase
MMEAVLPTRHQALINNDWTFMYGDIAEGKEILFDDSNWYDIGIPHSFGIPYFMENEFYVGYGCYRKHVDIHPEWIGKKISLEFQGAFQDADIYMNGAWAGNHKGGYTAFHIDISELVHEGDNVLFVRLNNLWNPRLAPRAGEHVFNGGIYRDVSLIVTEPVHVAWYGTFVTSSEISAESAALEARTEVVNDGPQTVDCLLVSIVEFAGAKICEMSSRQSIESGQSFEFTQQQLLTEPKLWHPDSPNLYRLKSCVYVDDALQDEYETWFGVRSIFFDARQGFFLNGEHYDIIGANVHQDHAGWGDAVTRAGMARDVKLIKDCGMNFIRGSHYPHHTHFSAECDKQGMLFWSELCFWGIGGANTEGYWASSAYPIHDEDKAEFEESCMRALQEMIRTNRNHPSIITWSMSNEPFFSDDAVMEEARALVVRLVAESRRLDPSRPAAVGGAQRQGFDALGDIAGYNGDGAALFIDPGFPNLVSEYGSVIGVRPGEYTPGYTDGVETNPRWRSGKALWCGFHHGSIASNMGYMGMIDYYRLPLNAWYWYRNELLGIEPPIPASTGIPYALRLTADKHTIFTDGTDDAHLVVEVLDQAGNRISNTLQVELEIVQGGGLFPTGKSIRFSPDNNSFLDGMGAIEMRSYFAGAIKIQAKAEGVQAAEISIEAVGATAWSGQAMRLQPAPPSVMKAPAHGSSYDIARSRPVFCSSFAEGHPAMSVTDDLADTCWKPGNAAEGQWIMVDLEGLKKAEQAAITFEEADASLYYELLYSSDGKTFFPLESRTQEETNTVVVDKLPSGGLRYLKVLFPTRPAAIYKVEMNT